MLASTLRKFGGGGAGDSSPQGRSQASMGSSWQLLGAAAGGVGVGGGAGGGDGSGRSSNSSGGNDAGARVISHTIVEGITAAAGTSVGEDRTPTFSQPSSSVDLAGKGEEEGERGGGEGEAAATIAQTTPTTTRFRPPGLDDDGEKPGARSTACGVIATGAVLVVMALVATVRGPASSSGRA